MDIIFKKNNKIYRKVKNTQDAENNIILFDKLGLFNGNIVKTKIYDKNEKLLEHEFIQPIIHSGEFTTSMAYDVTKCAIDLAIKLIDHKLFSYDLLPHNFTYLNGKWLLYDFGSFEPHPKNVKTQIRGTFKITFSAFELLKKVKRKDLKHYFLNRISHLYLLKMISFKNWAAWCFNQYYCLLLHKIGLHKKAYHQLNKYFNLYAKKHSYNIYSFEKSFEEDKLYNYIDEILTTKNIKSAFCIGEKSAQWAFSSKTTNNKFVYLDNYKTCDDYYNLIYKNNIPTISTAVIYPFMQDNEIDKNYSYRAIYDYFAKERFNTDSVIILNNNELIENKKFIPSVFAQNIMEFSTNLYIHKFDKHTEQNLAKDLKSEIEKYFNQTQLLEFDNNLILIAENKKYPLSDFSNLKQYSNNNRGNEAKLQSLEIIKILKNMNSTKSV